MKTITATIIFCILGNIVMARTITDMAGRTVEIPETIDKIFPYDPKTSILIFPLLYDKMVATSMLPGKKNYQYISKEYTNLPQVDVKNIEEVLLAAPQLIISGFYNKSDNTGPVMKLGSRTNIPVILIDLSIDKTGQTYAFLGKLFHMETESDKYVSYIEQIFSRIDSLRKNSAPVLFPVYYTLGTSGLLTDPSGSKHTEVFDFLGIPNAAKVEIPSGGHVEVNMEQILIWDPGYIFAAVFKSNNSAYETITTDSKWKSISAVQKKQVYKVPDQPFGWFDHPPSINRIPGLIWLCHIFYGQSENQTSKAIKEYYKLFYKYNLTEQEYRALFD